MYRDYVKRLIDIILSGLGLIVLAVPMVILALAVKLDSKGPVLFWQKRVGIHGETFMMPKFRTMYVETPAETPTHLLNDPQQWITRVGRVYRKCSIDEFPQLFCIFTGKMSIIGPRPALWNQYDLIAERNQYGANDVRPGLTGWAQINGRDELEISEKARLDGEYVKKLSFMFDCRCFYLTILAVSMARRGKRVLLIDCDLRNPSVAKVLGVRNEYSMADYLEGKVHIRDMLKPTEVDNLFIFGSQTATGRYGQRQFRDRTAQLIHASRRLFDYVILDTPPCSLLADAAEIADLAECGLMVIRQDFSSRDQILDGIQSLSESKLPLIGCALNNMKKNGA